MRYLFIVLFLSACGDKTPIPHPDCYKIFDGTVSIMKTEVTSEMWDSTTVIAGIELKIDISAEGHYLFDGWNYCYRCPDIHGGSIEIRHDGEDIHYTARLRSPWSRVEIFKYHDGTINRERVFFRHYGISGGAFNIQGQVTP